MPARELTPRPAAAAALTLALLGACAPFVTSFLPSAGPRGGAPAAGVPTYGVPRAGDYPGLRDTGLTVRPRSGSRPPGGAGGELAQRRVCRSTGVPNGWIAVAYEGGSSECPSLRVRGADSAATVAVIARYATAPVGTRLDVCADQRTPFGWSTVSDESAGDPGACPQAARDGHDTVRRIRREY